MKTRSLSLLLVSVLLSGLVGCSSASRIESRYNSRETLAANWAPAIQEKVRAGIVEVGFNRDQVWVALGEPDQVTARSNGGDSVETWTYRTSSLPRISLGFGIGVGGGHTAAGGGVGVSSAPKPGRDRITVVFRNGLVTSVTTVSDHR